jgi:hypothetical protein
MGAGIFWPRGFDQRVEGDTLVENLTQPAITAPGFSGEAGFTYSISDGQGGGATAGVMPSLYEPFGMANEFYLNGTLAIGRAGAINAALLAASIVGLVDVKIMANVERWRARQTSAVAKAPSDDAAAPHR